MGLAAILIVAMAVAWFPAPARSAAQISSSAEQGG
jgi:hypothetical protein